MKYITQLLGKCVDANMRDVKDISISFQHHYRIFKLQKEVGAVTHVVLAWG